MRHIGPHALPSGLRAISRHVKACGDGQSLAARVCMHVECAQCLSVAEWQRLHAAVAHGAACFLLLALCWQCCICGRSLQRSLCMVYTAACAFRQVQLGAGTASFRSPQRCMENRRCACSNNCRHGSDSKCAHLHVRTVIYAAFVIHMRVRLMLQKTACVAQSFLCPLQGAQLQTACVAWPPLLLVLSFVVVLPFPACTLSS